MRVPRARATKPSTGISSARAVGSRPAASSSGKRIGAERLQALPQHLAALAEGRLGDALEHARRSQGRGLARGMNCTTDEVTLGGGTKADGAMSNRIFACVRQPASTESRP